MNADVECNDVFPPIQRTIRALSVRRHGEKPPRGSNPAAPVVVGRTKGDSIMRKQLRVTVMASASLTVLFSLPQRADAYTESFCEQTRLCADPGDGLLSDGSYVGHDEPALLFYSSKAGSGNSAYYFVTLPTEPTNPPSAGGV